MEAMQVAHRRSQLFESTGAAHSSGVLRAGLGPHMGHLHHMHMLPTDEQAAMSINNRIVA